MQSISWRYIMEIRKIRPADAEKFVEFYEKLVKESD